MGLWRLRWRDTATVYGGWEGKAADGHDPYISNLLNPRPTTNSSGEREGMGWKAAEKIIQHWKILRGDNVMIIRGKDKGEINTIKRVIRSQNRVIVEEKNMVYSLYYAVNEFAQLVHRN
ncbi:hypothetical protein Cni_G25965 [Canna indica]|uniref:KOW domain-containing protein n=1 Tax=Canna indica TaxID=4628 RepID=A0AAQ3QPY9_9LILI|nr:hypothetical protein Cni_G25965 [Canna indica]